MTFTPCSSKHKSCSPAHAALVAEYRSERHRQEVAFENQHKGYLSDAKFWKAKGYNLIDFRQWLKAHKRTERVA